MPSLKEEKEEFADDAELGAELRRWTQANNASEDVGVGLKSESECEEEFEEEQDVTKAELIEDSDYEVEETIGVAELPFDDGDETSEQAYSIAQINLPSYTEKELTLQQQHGLDEEHDITEHESFMNLKNVVKEKEEKVGPTEVPHPPGFPHIVVDAAKKGDFDALWELAHSEEAEQLLSAGSKKGKGKGKSKKR